MVVRDRGPVGVSDVGPGIEVLLLRRNLRSAFVGGVHLFPGGAVDPVDSSPQSLDLCTGRTDEQASRMLGVVSGGLGVWFAAVRECFEEAGLLLATTADGAWPNWSQGPTALQQLRSAATQPDYSFATMLTQNSLVIPADRILYWSRWVTPVGAVRRYDTRFFICVAPAHQDPQHDAVEAVEHSWAKPEEVLLRNDHGAVALVTPTRKSLEALARFGSVDELLRVAAHDIATDGPAASLLPMSPVRHVRASAVAGFRSLAPGDGAAAS
jgi:8-oxo-dGTP pyrophosphatase MutT (NUDIX family)